MERHAAGNIEQNRWYLFLHFFPFKLILLHLKHNHFFLLLWVAVFSLVARMAALKYGVPYLLLAPEYQNEVGIWAHIIMGFSVGGFIMAFNIYSYMMYGFKFPFIATLSRPFLKFCINNFIIPLAFIVLHVYNMADLQLNEELISGKQVFINVLGYLLGCLIFFSLSLYYFFRTNRDIFRMKPETRRKLLWWRRKSAYAHVDGPAVKTTFRKRRKGEPISMEHGWYVSAYLTQTLQLRLARTPEHYDEQTLRRVFSQNHLNASLYELALLISFIALGSLRDFSFFAIPAGASLLLTFTLIVMIYSVFFSYFRWWTPTVLIAIVLAFNALSAEFDFLRFKSYAYGMDYDGEPAPYTIDRMRKLTASDVVNADKQRGEVQLSHWKAKFADEQKPKLVLINVSGGGLRSTYWSFRVMQVLDSLSGGQLMNHVNMITGSSGGMMGLAYFRELHKQRVEGIDVNVCSHYYLDELGRDILNPIALSIATTDMFVRYQFFNDGPYRYSKDRGYAFERKYNENTLGLLENKRLRDYELSEYAGLIPVMVLSPTIINDGRRLIIASQPVSYLCAPDSLPGSVYSASPENIEFTRLYNDQDAWNLRFTSAIRMSATFPYVMPMVSLPSSPRVEIMDAGLRDNLGLKLSLQYLDAFSAWIKENTSGVLIIRIRDSEKNRETEEGVGSLMYRILRPFGSLYGNFIQTQEFDTDQMLSYFRRSCGYPIELREISLSRSERSISLSWHLTALEKKNIRQCAVSDATISVCNAILGDLGIDPVSGHK
jgi:hypothetical protein